MPPSILYSFPNRIGAGRICHTAWNQANGLASNGLKVFASVISFERDIPGLEGAMQTMAVGKWKAPLKLIGRLRSFSIHDFRTSRWLDKNHEKVDLVHCWPLGSRRTLSIAKKHGIPTLLERPNAYTGFAFKASAAECDRLGLKLDNGHDHSFNKTILEREEDEYQKADYLLCPSEFVARTFEEAGYSRNKLLRHQYGYDQNRFRPSEHARKPGPIRFLYAGACEPRKGLHFILDAWHRSKAIDLATLDICGAFVPGYRDTLGDKLTHPSIRVLGHCDEIHKRMREADVFTLASVEEGSALVTYEARASGCVLAVSDATGAPCTHRLNALVHPAKDTTKLTEHFNELVTNKELLDSLRKQSISSIDQLSWGAAAVRLTSLYREASNRRS